MLAELRIELDSENLDYRQSSNLQGVIMESIFPEYADHLHRSTLNPYSQCLIKEKEKKIWYIRTITEEAYENVLLPMAQKKEIEIKGGKVKAKVLKREIELYSEEDLMREFYEERCPRYFTLDFLTPTAFKRDDKYVNYPELRLLYGSLMRKYSAASGMWNMEDEETLEQLTESSGIIQYKLQTMPFPLEKVKIYGFRGTVCIHVRGPETMARYVRLLLRFGRFSGVGIKTGMGMGAVHFAEWREKDERR